MLPSSVGLFLSFTVRSVPRRPSPASAAEWPSQQSYLLTSSLLFELDDWVAGSSTQCLLHLIRTKAVDTSAQFTQSKLKELHFTEGLPKRGQASLHSPTSDEADPLMRIVSVHLACLADWICRCRRFHRWQVTKYKNTLQELKIFQVSVLSFLFLPSSLLKQMYCMYFLLLTLEKHACGFCSKGF